MQVFLSPVTEQAFTNETDIVEFKRTGYPYLKIAQNDHPMYSSLTLIASLKNTFLDR